ncbi:GNAT family N-acetyltransferase [Ruania alkalisoli]|uniref:GNAT family N-acetyltransferase n=1 Tax=Ruania alkalisoli TaxID=2779775 RepID=A0A7M1SND3_9MICO|nr:GNAT family N-acetyltransferase [Ruania alkalisoli]QOR69068.1 GNAT family N-acetyltransferase [Ruania alkalisoli]
MTATFRRLGSLADLGDSWSSLPVLRADVPRYRQAIWWATPEALALSVDAGESTRSLVGVGAPAGLARVVAEAFTPDGVPHPGSGVSTGQMAVVSLTRGTWDLVPGPVRASLGTTSVSHWDWMVCTRAPVHQTGEDDVIELDLSRDLPEMTALQERVLPDTYTRLDKPGTRWFGWRDRGGRLGAMAAASGWTDEVHLGSILTHPDLRRRGLASAVTAAVTRAGLAATGQVSLGLYASNVVARRVYERLGFTLAQEWESRRP